PAAYYQGDINSEKNNFQTTYMGTKGEVIASPFGTFSGNNLIRFDTPIDLSSGGEFEWSYSTDNGINWVSAKGSLPASTEETSSVSLFVPAGGITATAETLSNVTRYSVSSLGSSSSGDTITVNSVTFTKNDAGEWESDDANYELTANYDSNVVKISTNNTDTLGDLTISVSGVDETVSAISSGPEAYSVEISANGLLDGSDDTGSLVATNISKAVSGSTLTATVEKNGVSDVITFRYDGSSWSSSNSDYSLNIDSEGKVRIASDDTFRLTKAEAELKESGYTSLRLPLPEGYVDLKITGDLASGSQIMIHPEDASLDYEILKDTYISVNAVGKDIFGGLYSVPDGEGGYTDIPALQDKNEGCNLFEVVGDFIAYLETNCQEGCQEALAKLTKAEEYLLTQATKVGGLENRVDVAYDVLTSQKQDIAERLSYIEDIDLTELLVKMQQQQITYQTVLQSASKIMNMSLANYI
ncbi:MAG: hypothetical protein K5657_05745, partial [Desulfovibrio sp.]|nr:hypothetical protein [Desulfovibrio sp.]